jgi:hypothetical protein
MRSHDGIVFLAIGLDSDPYGARGTAGNTNSSCHLAAIVDVLFRQGYRSDTLNPKNCDERVTIG